MDQLLAAHKLEKPLDIAGLGENLYSKEVVILDSLLLRSQVSSE